MIRDKLAEGWTEDEIKDYFVAQFGDRVLAEPPRRGLNWLAYIIPPLAFLAGIFVLYRAFRVWRQSSAAPETIEIQSDSQRELEDKDEYIDRLEEELQKL